MKKFRGTGVAIVTPFKNDSSIDFAAAGRIVNHVIEGGVNYVVVMGTTGESATLTTDEKQAMISWVVEVVDKRVPVVAGIGGYNTQEVINCIRNIDLTGVEGILSVAPYYNKPNQRGLFEHFKEIATCSPLPVIIYNVPGRTCCNILPETCLKLASECQNIIGIKEASGDMGQIMKILRNKPDNFLLISGDDMITLPVIAAGGSGVISVLANAFPSQWSEMVSHALRTNLKAAREIHYRYMEMIELLFVEGNPAGIKAIMNVLGICQNNLRLPLVPVTKATYQKIQKAVEDIKKS